MSPEANVLVCAGDSFPRVSGDEPVVVCVGTPGSEFSPRERG